MKNSTLENDLKLYAHGYADACAALHDAEMNLRIFEATAYLNAEGTAKEREAWVVSDPGYKKLCMATTKALRAAQHIRDGMKVAEVFVKMAVNGENAE